MTTLQTKYMVFDITQEAPILKRVSRRRRRWITLLAILVVIFFPYYCYHYTTTIKQIEKCSINNLHQNTTFLDNAVPITHTEFIDRRDRLARALVVEGIDAFIVEPGFTFQYYGNISQHDWEPWEPEERPFLMIVQPVQYEHGIKSKLSFLSPHFEEGRVRMLGIPAEEELNIVVWEEHWNPYATLKNKLFEGKEGVKLMVDEEMRDYISRGLTSAGFDVTGLRGEVEKVRQIKSSAEVELIRAVNTGTVEAIRAMRPCLVPGLTEDEVVGILNKALLSLGFSLFFNVVLFEENAALPHGGFATGGKQLKADDMVLIDVGAHYLGYSSDVCRSFFIPPPQNLPTFVSGAISPFKIFTESKRRSELYAEKLKVWNTVLAAQSASIRMLQPNNTAANVDIAAREIIRNAGYGKYFTHRVGHGIGIKAHESPYLHKGNHDTVLRAGMVFTVEPGVYLTGKFGVRHEDIYIVKTDGEAELLNGRRATSPWDP